MHDLVAKHRAGDVTASRILADRYINSHQYDVETVKEFKRFYQGLDQKGREEFEAELYLYTTEHKSPLDEWEGWVSWMNRVARQINATLNGVQ